ncbi:hypothetical protein [Natronorubrum thiooxidans]|uniref:Uncharacterized protein n=1 Tax=Natronorubrum thiooxidans TaxID=308853 RepID=A0A1N7H7H8_9EURY|nr:hypothetical protein [Natronorubrum thiooxidans]SIS20761.1 hypothetical protein SAMN05421752_1298 [Natronorubrum thiooxidans]
MDNSQEERLKTLGILPSQTNNETDEEDDTPPNYIMVCHECGHRITRERACKTTRKAKSGKMWWKGCEHPIYFARNAIDGLRDKDVLEALIHLDTTTITIEAEEFERLDVHVDLLDEPDAHLMDITYLGFSDEAELEEEEDGHFPFNRGILRTGYHKNDDTDDLELIQPKMEAMIKSVNDNLGSDDTTVQLLELSTPNV